MRVNRFCISATKCMKRSWREHEDLVAEFSSLTSRVEATLQATGMKVEYMTYNDLFLEIKRALVRFSTMGADKPEIGTGDASQR